MGSQDGCRTNNTEYVVRANYTWVFTDFNSTTNYTNTEYRYSAAVAIPYTQEAVDALARACPEATFAINTTTDVLGCLYCPVVYDIFFPLSNDTFTLGASNNLTCTPEERPTDVEESIFVRVVAVTPSASPSISASPSASISSSASFSASSSRSISFSASSTRSASVSASPSLLASPTSSISISVTPTRSASTSVGPSNSAAVSGTRTPSNTPSVSSSLSRSRPPVVLPTASRTPSISRSSSVSGTMRTATASSTASLSFGASLRLLLL